MSAFEALRADIIWTANTGKTAADVAELGAVWSQTTNAMSDESLRLAVAQEKVNKAVARSGPESTAAKSATIAYRREVAALSAAQTTAAATTERTAASAATKARETVRAAASERTALEELLGQYRRLASAAESSAEQRVAAAKLAADAERRLGLVAVGVGGRGGGALSAEERQAQRFGRGALAGGLRGGGVRAAAFGSTAFLGGTGLVFALESVSKAAAEQQVAEGQLATALRNRGEATDRLRGKIAGLVADNAKLGFGEHDVTQALALGVTATGSLEGATRLLSVAQNVARARGTDLTTANKLLVRAFEGQSRSLKALGIDVKAGTKGYEILDQVQGKYAGRAQAYSATNAGAFARERAELERTRVTIGNQLLPAELKLANAVSGYLGKASNQRKIQHDVNQAIHVGTDAVHGLVGAYHLVAPPVRLVNRLLGGTKHSVELLALAFLGLKLRAVATDLGLVASRTKAVGAAAVAATPEVEGLAVAEGDAAAAGGAGGAARGAGGLRGARVAALGVLGPIGVATAAGIVARNAAAQAGLDRGLVTGVHVGRGNDRASIFERNGRYYVEYVDTGSKNRPGGGRSGTFPISRQEAFALYGVTLPERNAPEDGPNGVSAAAEAAAKARAGEARSPQPPLPRPQLDRLTRIQLAVQRAQLAVARGDKGAQAQLLKALADEVAFDRDYEKRQERLERTDVAHKADHAKTLEGLYADEQQALGQVQQIADERARTRKDAADKRTRAADKAKREREAEARKRAAEVRKAQHEREAAARKAAADYRSGLRATETGLETGVTTATRKADTAGTLHALAIDEQQQRTAERLLVAFYDREARDPKLNGKERAAAKKKAADARSKLARDEQRDDRGAILKLAVDRAKTALAEATAGTAAYAKAKAAEDRALQAEIDYYTNRAHNSRLSLKAQRSALLDELGARRAKAALDKTHAKAGGGSRAEQQVFLGEVQRIIGAYAPNFFAQPGQPGSTGKLETHGYETVHELRQIKSHLARLGRADRFPASAYGATADAASAVG